MDQAPADAQTDNSASPQPRKTAEQASPEPAGNPKGITYESVMNKPLPPGATIGHFSKNEKIRRLLWTITQATIFRFSPRRADNWRAWLLRCFGAKVGRVKLLRSTVRIEVPWNIEIGDGAQIGDRVYLYSLGPISIGEHTVISQFCHICAGTHDFERSDFPLLRVPIRIGDRCWIAAETYVAPGVTIADGVVVGARGGVMKDLPAWSVCIGSPAKPVRPRYLFDARSGERLDPGDRD